MRSFTLIKLLAVSLILGVAACKPLHRQESDLQAAKSKEGHLLMAQQGSHPDSICIVKTVPQQGGGVAHTLITKDGGITAKQLKEALRFSSHATNILGIAIPILAAGGIMLIAKPFVKKLEKQVDMLYDKANKVHDDLHGNIPTKEELDASTKDVLKGDRLFHKSEKITARAGISSGAVLITGGGAVQLITGVKEGESKKETLIRSLVGGASLGVLPTFEEWRIRNKRISKLQSNEETWHITDKKMQKITERISKLHPTIEGACNNLKHF